MKMVLAAVAHNGIAIMDASYELRADKEVVLVAVAKDRYESALGYASNELKDDKAVVLAVTRDGRALKYASIALKADMEVALFFTFRLFSTPRGLKRVASP